MPNLDFSNEYPFDFDHCRRRYYSSCCCCYCYCCSCFSRSLSLSLSLLFHLQHFLQVSLRSNSNNNIIVPFSPLLFSSGQVFDDRFSLAQLSSSDESSRLRSTVLSTEVRADTKALLRKLEHFFRIRFTGDPMRRDWNDFQHLATQGRYMRSKVSPG